MFLLSFLRRQRQQVLLLSLLAALVWALFFRSSPSAISKDSSVVVRDAEDKAAAPAVSSSSSPDFVPIKCRINDQVLHNVALKATTDKSRSAAVDCLMDEDDKEVYVPFFGFLKDYFDVYGELKGNGSFAFAHSYSKVFPSLREKRYAYNDSFLQFAEFDVEGRKRVKCVSAKEGVPVSTQWDKEGYFYSTQISQFALSHWSKNLMAKDVKYSKTVYEDGVEHKADWRGDLTRVTSLRCVHFDTTSKLSLRLDNKKQQLFLTFSLQFRQNTNVSVSLKSGGNINYNLVYAPVDTLITRAGNDVILGYGSNLIEGEWKSFTRNLLGDLEKGLSKRAFSAIVANDGVTVREMSLVGVGCIANVSLSNQEHIRLFLTGADWLVRSQQKGGWPVGAVFNRDRSKYPGAEEVGPGWYSAMAQGHALSVLSRAYGFTKDESYLDSAFRALEPFGVNSDEPGGILTHFMGTLRWYEEYPTVPSTFVLNGFMYSLLGLFDLKDLMEKSKLEKHEKFAEVSELWEEGMKSLKTMLPLFDTGSGSVYDLRHFTMSGVEPKVARWDYHSTHVNLLYVLSTLEDGESSVLSDVAERWRRYMMGKRAKHN